MLKYVQTMSQITSIEQQQKDKTRCSVYIDGAFYCGLKIEVAVKYRLKPGMSVEKSRIDEIQLENEKLQAVEKAMNHLRARLYDAQKASIDANYSEKRRLQVGSGDRSERIRTYNYPQGRVTDHRINLTLYKLDEVVSGEALGEIIEALVTEDQARRLAEND